MRKLSQNVSSKSIVLNFDSEWLFTSYLKMLTLSPSFSLKSKLKFIYMLLWQRPYVFVLYFIPKPGNAIIIAPTRHRDLWNRIFESTYALDVQVFTNWTRTSTNQQQKPLKPFLHLLEPGWGSDSVNTLSTINKPGLHQSCNDPL